MQNFFWDSCIVAALLSEQSDTCDLPSIERYLRDAKHGGCQIHLSTVTMAEITPSHIKHRRYTSFNRFMKDLEGSVVPIAPDPNIMSLAAKIRDIPYTKQVNNAEVAKRGMDVPDAVMLASAIILEDGYGVKLDEFHTYDNGKKRSVNGGKCVPLLDYESWCSLLTPKYMNLAKRVIALKRRKPVHPTPDIPGI